jgi:glycosyltransferase 2 family protein
MSTAVTQARTGEQAKKWLFLCIRIAVVVVIYFFIIQQVPLSNLRPLMVPALVTAFALAVLLNILQAMLCTVRWRLVAAKIPNVPGFAKSFAAYMEGLFFNQALPSFIGGDAVRVLRWRACKVKASEALLSVFRDRLFGAIGAATFAMMACALLWPQPIEHYKVLSMFALSSAVTVGCVIVLSLSQWPRLSMLFSRFRKVHELVEELASRPLDRTAIWHSLWVSVIAQLLPGIAVFALAMALDIEISLLLAIAVTGAILLVSMIPISLAGWGVREAGFMVILVPMGTPSENALMLGICFGLAGLCGALTGGLSIALGLAAPSSTAEP